MPDSLSLSTTSSPGDQISSDLICGTTTGEDKTTLSVSRFEVAICCPLEPMPPEESPHVCRNCDVDAVERKGGTETVTRRRKRRRGNSFFITISHMLTSSLDDVGLQLWRGSLLLADFLLHVTSRGSKHFQEGGLQGSTVLELGAGVGFLGVILSLLPCKRVFLTDMSNEIIQLIEKNVATNAHIFASSSFAQQVQSSPPSVHTRVLDWRDVHFDLRNAAHYSGLVGGWTQEDATLAEDKVTWLAADVIYDDEVTTHLFQTLSRAMRPGEHLYLAVEKRYNFEINSLSVVAHGYQHFLSLINKGDDPTSTTAPYVSLSPSTSVSNAFTRGGCDIQQSKGTCECGSHCQDTRVDYVEDDTYENDFSNTIHTLFNVSWGVSLDENEETQQVFFRGARVPLECCPQAVLSYDRTEDLELWDITLALYESTAQKGAAGQSHT